MKLFKSERDIRIKLLSRLVPILRERELDFENK